MVYNASAYDSATSFLDIFITSNDMAGGWITIMLLIIIWIAIIVGLSATSSGAIKGVIASFVVFIIALMFWSAELIGVQAVTVSVILFVIGVAYDIFTGDK